MTKKIPLSIVIGGTGGIGSAIVDLLRSRGDQVMTVGRSSSQNVDISCDVSTTEGRLGFVDAVQDKKIDNLIFAHRYRGDEEGQDFNVAFNSVEEVIKLVSSSLESGSCIVLLSSVAARQVLDEQSGSYHGSRAALESLTRFLAVRMGVNNIRVNCVLPTTLIKDSNKEFFQEGNSVHDLIADITPLKRMGHARDIADLVEFLCSERSSFITGQGFLVDGGLSLVNQETIARRLTGLLH